MALKEIISWSAINKKKGFSLSYINKGNIHSFILFLHISDLCRERSFPLSILFFYWEKYSMKDTNYPSRFFSARRWFHREVPVAYLLLCGRTAKSRIDSSDCTDVVRACSIAKRVFQNGLSWWPLVFPIHSSINVSENEESRVLYARSFFDLIIARWTF